MTRHERLRVVLRALELRRGLRRPEDPEPSRAKRVDDTRGERRLGTDDRQRDVLVPREGDEVGDRGSRYRGQLRLAHRSRVAGRDEHLGDARRLRDFPRERVLASAASDDQDVHAIAVT